MFIFGIRRAAAALLVGTAVLLADGEALCGSITIAGNGPELPTIEQLARAFEKRHLGRYVQIRWDLSSQPFELVKSGEADVAVTGHIDTGLTATPIAWDGIVVVVDFTNPVKAVTRQEVAAIFTRVVTRWSQLGGPDSRGSVRPAAGPALAGRRGTRAHDGARAGRDRGVALGTARHRRARRDSPCRSRHRAALEDRW